MIYILTSFFIGTMVRQFFEFVTDARAFETR